MFTERLTQRIAGRKAATECFGLLEGDTEHHHYWESFVDEIETLCGIRAAKIEKEAKESKPTPIARLGQMQMVFGAHKGKSFDEIPIDYLDWLCRNQEDFYKCLREYLRHPELESRRRGLE